MHEHVNRPFLLRCNRWAKQQSFTSQQEGVAHLVADTTGFPTRRRRARGIVMMVSNASGHAIRFFSRSSVLSCAQCRSGAMASALESLLWPAFNDCRLASAETGAKLYRSLWETSNVASAASCWMPSKPWRIFLDMNKHFRSVICCMFSMTEIALPSRYSALSPEKACACDAQLQAHENLPRSCSKHERTNLEVFQLGDAFVVKIQNVIELRLVTVSAAHPVEQKSAPGLQYLHISRDKDRTDYSLYKRPSE